MEIIIAGILIAGVGIFVGLFLGVAGAKFEVEVDPRETEILGCLPGNNCGGCGYPGCSGLAAAIVKGEAPVNQCPVGGAAVGSQIAEIMGVTVEEKTRMVAYVSCSGTCEKAKEQYVYVGMKDCSMAKRVPGGGSKACSYGCLGFGNCASVCERNAISIVDGIAVVNKEECLACGLCVKACPNNLISLIPYDATQVVACSSKDTGKVVTQVCSAGCIGCKLCEKNCPSDAIHVVDNVAVIDQDKCTHCGTCAEKCPKKVIVKP